MTRTSLVRRLFRVVDRLLETRQATRRSEALLCAVECLCEDA